VQERGPESALTSVPGARRWGVVVPLAVGVVVLDHATKWWALQELPGRTIDLVWTLRLRLVFNTGAAFGLGSRFAPLIAIAALVVVGLLLRNAGVLRSWPSAVGVGLVLGGAVGNLIDRAFRAGGGFLGGAVVDFIDLQWWPVFNVADIAIVAGAALVAFTSALEPAPDDEVAPTGADREAP
jgi:signal peptidase II